MKLQKNSLISCVLLIQIFSLCYSDEFPKIDNNVRRIETIHHDSQDLKPSGYCSLYVGVQKENNHLIPVPTNYVIAKYGSVQLKSFLATVVTPMIRAVTIGNYHCVLPGYASPHGLRDCLANVSHFSRSDAIVANRLNERIEAYCTRIEKILFDKHGMFCQTLSFDKQVNLAKIYAEFLQEFYCSKAKDIFERDASDFNLKQNVINAIKWNEISYNDKDYVSSKRQIEQRYAGSLNENLGVVYLALHTGDSEKAYTVGHQRVKTEYSRILCGKKEKITSVFEQYPDLQKIVEQKYCADKAKANQERIAKEVAVQQKTMLWQEKYKIGIDKQKCVVPSDLLSQRYNAAYQDHIVKFYERVYKVSSEEAARIVPEFLSSNKKEIVFEGSHLQHHFFAESISVIDTVISCDLVEPIKEAALDLANASLMFNKAGDIITTSYTLDTCWAIIDFGKKAARWTYLKGIAATEGIIEGAAESLSGAAHVVCHPIQAAQDFCESLATVGYCLGQAMRIAAEYEAAAIVTEIDSHLGYEMMKKLADESMLPVLFEQAKTISVKDVTHFGTKTIGDIILFNGAIKVVSSVAKGSVSTFLSCMRKGMQSADVAITAEGVPVRCAEEMVSLMENIGETGGSAAKVISESRMLIENMVNVLKTEITVEIATLREKFACISNCLPDCGKRGFAEFINKHIKIPYEHILGIELIWNEAKNTLAGISGFHHDFMGAIENSNLLKFVRKGIEKNGCYMADIILEGKSIRDKTFFPQHWSREKVISKIYEAYENFIKSGEIAELCSDGKYKIQSLTNEGIKIEMYITSKGHIKSAYPIVQMEL